MMLINFCNNNTETVYNILRRFSLTIIILSGLHPSGISQAPCRIPDSAERIVFLGNSITYAGHYVSYIEAYLTVTCPGRHFEFINFDQWLRMPFPDSISAPSIGCNCTVISGHFEWKQTIVRRYGKATAWLAQSRGRGFAL